MSLGSARAGEIVSAEPVGGKDKLTQVEVNVGGEDPLRIVTNAPNAKQGNRVVVATIGATVGDVVVKKASVGGAPSEGMLCDCPMLGAGHDRPADKIFALRSVVFCRRLEGGRRGGRCADPAAVCAQKGSGYILFGRPCRLFLGPGFRLGARWNKRRGKKQGKNGRDTV